MEPIYPFFIWHLSRRAFWFRIFGYGLLIKDKRQLPPLYSERCGSRKFYYIGWLGFNFLKPE